MSRLQAMIADPDLPIADMPELGAPPVRQPRAADEVDVPVASPVHVLQEQLRCLGEGQSVGAIAEDKVPGWLRLALPVVVSVGLWAIILRIVGVID